jgi:hypothetical protein
MYSAPHSHDVNVHPVSVSGLESEQTTRTAPPSSLFDALHEVSCTPDRERDWVEESEERERRDAVDDKDVIVDALQRDRDSDPDTDVL